MPREQRYIDASRIDPNQQTLYDYEAGKWCRVSEIPDAIVKCKDCIYCNKYVYKNEEYLSCNNEFGLYRDVPEDAFCYQGSAN